MGRDNMKIVIPSAGRAKNVMTDLPGQILVVPAEQEQEYKENNDCEIITHPAFKRYGAKANWILKHFNEDLFLIDDDCIHMVSVFNTLKRAERNQTPENALKIIHDSYLLAKELRVFLFAFSESPVPIQFNGLKPYEAWGTFCGGAYGIINGGGLHFSENTTGCNSQYLNLLNMKLHGRCLINKMYSCEFLPTFHNVGGLCGVRTTESEKRDLLYLRMQFGEVVQMRKNSRNKKNHNYQKRLDYGKAL
jgi:hypothetical protein